MSKKKHSRHRERVTLPIGEQLAVIERVEELLVEIKEKEEGEVRRAWEAQKGRPIDLEKKEIITAMETLAGNQGFIENLYVRMVLFDKERGIKRTDEERFLVIRSTREAIGTFLREREAA